MSQILPEDIITFYENTIAKASEVNANLNTLREGHNSVDSKLTNLKIYNVADYGGLSQTITEANGQPGYIFFPPGSYNIGSVTEIPKNLTAWFSSESSIFSSVTQTIIFWNMPIFSSGAIGTNVQPIFKSGFWIQASWWKDLKADALYTSNNNWYSDSECTIPSTDNTDIIRNIISTLISSSTPCLKIDFEGGIGYSDTIEIIKSLNDTSIRIDGLGKRKTSLINMDKSGKQGFRVGKENFRADSVQLTNICFAGNMESGDGVELVGTHCEIINCSILNNGGIGLRLGSNQNHTADGTWNCRIEANLIFGNGHGIEINDEGNANVIRKNAILNNLGCGILGRGFRGTIIEENDIENNGYEGIYLIGGSVENRNTTVYNNYLEHNCSAPSGHSGLDIRINGANGSIVSPIVSGNFTDTSGAAYIGIDLCKNPIVTNNHAQISVGYLVDGGNFADNYIHLFEDSTNPDYRKCFERNDNIDGRVIEGRSPLYTMRRKTNGTTVDIIKYGSVGNSNLGFASLNGYFSQTSVNKAQVPALSFFVDENNYFSYNDVTDQTWSLSGIKATAVIFPGVINPSTQYSHTFAVTGAHSGQDVRIFPPYDLQGCMVSAYISSTGNVTLLISNNTGSSVSLESSTWGFHLLEY